MNYDGVVIRLNELLYLFILNPDTNEIMDGINISDHKCYKEMSNTQLMVVKVTFKDGTKDIDSVDLEEFIYGDSYGTYDTFLHIKDLTLYSIGDKTGIMKNISFKDIIEQGELSSIAIECIELTKKQLEETND